MTLNQLKNRVLRMLGRALLLAVQEKGGRQFLTIDISDGDNRELVERLQQYGHHSWPPETCDIVYAALGANRNITVALSAQDPGRPPLLKMGDSAIYGLAGNTVYCHADGSIELRPAPGKPIIFNSQMTTFAGNVNVVGNQTITGALNVTGVIRATVDVFAGLISLLNHKSSGVVPGSGVSGPPTP